MSKEKNKTELPQVVEGELRTRLIKLREDAGYDISQMADALCLSEDVIINLENEDFENLAEPPYVRGYLRNYAKLGEEDPSELITRYEALRGADASELDYQIKPSIAIDSSSKRRISPVWAQLILLGLLIGGIAFLSTIPSVKNWFSETWTSVSSQLLDPNDASDNPSLIGDLPVPIPLPEDEAATATAQNLNATNTTTEAEQNTTTSENQTNTPTTTATTNNTDTASNTTESATTEKQTETSAQPETATQEETATATTEETTAGASGDVINIKLVFAKEVWLRIKDKENKTVFEGLNKEGTEKIVDLAKPLTFRVGNAQGLSLFIDDKAVDISSYINGSIANFTLE